MRAAKTNRLAPTLGALAMGVVSTAACGIQIEHGGEGSHLGKIGAPCVPAEEQHTGFSGFSATGIDILDRALDCQSGLCLVANFQGRVTCPYGRASVPVEGDTPCSTPDGRAVTVEVPAQLLSRRASVAVTCSCRCAGEGSGPFCSCPAGFVCTPLVEASIAQYGGSYCLEEGTAVGNVASILDGPMCDELAQNCDDP